MPKLTLTDDERIRLSEYIGFLLRNPNPCTTCFEGSGCCGCKEQSEWCDAKKKYDVDSLLKYEEVSKYVGAHIDLKAVNDRIDTLLRQQKELESNIRERMADFDPAFCKGEKVEDSVKNLELVEDSEKKIEDKTEFYCKDCKMRFTVPDDECRIAFDGEGRCDANVYKYYSCPKCGKICWHND